MGFVERLLYLSDNVADLPAAADVRDLFRRVWL